MFVRGTLSADDLSDMRDMVVMRDMDIIDMGDGR